MLRRNFLKAMPVLGVLGLTGCKISVSLETKVSELKECRFFPVNDCLSWKVDATPEFFKSNEIEVKGSNLCINGYWNYFNIQDWVDNNWLVSLDEYTISAMEQHIVYENLEVVE